jgi:uncharacterized protein (TIGR00725 family)
MSERKFIVSVVGGHKCDGAVGELAEEIGAIVASRGAVLVSGGLGGVMESACKGARLAGGITVGIIPGQDKDEANGFVDIVLPTGMGFSRNTLVAGSADLVVAFPGSHGTLSEIAFALIGKKPVYAFGAWDVEGVARLESSLDFEAALDEHIGKAGKGHVG